MRRESSRLRRFAVHGVFWRQYLDWAILNTPFYMHFVLLCFWTLFFFFFAAPARRAVIANLRVVLPESPRVMNYLRALRTFYNFAWTISDGAIYRLTKAEFRYHIIGSEFLEQLAAAPGAIVLTAHMGNYDLGAALFAQKFNRPIQMVRAPEPHDETEEHLRTSLREMGEGGVSIAYNTAGALLSFGLLDALRRGEIVSIQGDRVVGDVAPTDGRLFGRCAQLPNGPFILARAAEVPIFPLFIVRGGYRSYEIIVREPIRVCRHSVERQNDIAPAVTQWCNVLEQTIAQHCSQWFGFAPVFARNVAR
ncbi:MAG: lysophospholipid acyltransferase family protein [Chthoniobacterales bacterium]